MLQLISLLLLAYSFFLIQTSISHLPPTIPTHFNAAGVANGWGSPNTLWFLLGVQAFACAVLLIVPYVGRQFPGTVHFGSRRLSDFLPAQRPRMLAILNEMAGCLSIVMNLFFVFMLREMIHEAAQPVPHFHPRGMMLFLLVGMPAVLLFYLWKFQRAARSGSSGEDNPSNEIIP